MAFHPRRRAPRSSVAARTLISSWAFSERSISAITSSVSPLSPMITTGTACALARATRCGVRVSVALAKYKQKLEPRRTRRARRKIEMLAHGGSFKGGFFVLFVSFVVQALHHAKVPFEQAVAAAPRERSVRAALEEGGLPLALGVQAHRDRRPRQAPEARHGRGGSRGGALEAGRRSSRSAPARPRPWSRSICSPWSPFQA